MRAFLRTMGAAMAIGLLWLAWRPAAGELFSTSWLHYLAHFSVFAVFAAVWALAFPDVPPAAMALGVVSFGVLHETLEIVGHGHAFEVIDAFVNAAGAITGIILSSRTKGGKRQRGRTP